ncbi:hypothetical protein QBC38DRAFT_485587 [Podospora fimiseda]|uniref:C2H2-type domain-containing protein n=1 Tax=Podospora fimiseda TaxID=252190 RepID=A0AAN7BJD4_9PEZI|nr:hypothetical protein QBC38DRAFT_485587 [Podospora fimiseda]
MSQPTAMSEESPLSQDYPHGELIFNHDFKLRGNWKHPAKSTATSGTSRSPSPMTSSESSNYYAPSESNASSWATSAEPPTECGFPNDDDAEGWKWDDESGSQPGRMPKDCPSTPADRVARSLRRSPSRPSSLRNAISMRDQQKKEDTKVPSAEYAESESDESGVESGQESEGESDDEDEDDNDWSGENENLESLVISAVGLDYSLAAHLIPLIHRDFNGALKSKVESWRCGTTTHGGGETSPGGNPSSANTSPTQGSGSARKRRRANSNGDIREDNGWNEDEDYDDGKDLGNMGPPSSPTGPRDSPLLACPFHKKDPIKYSMHRESGTAKKHKYRPCTGPGFKSIQRLKEHLRRTHSPVQCERCKETFNPGKGGDRAESLNKLAEHRKSENPCPLRDASLKEGVDEVQWAMLDKQNRRKNAEAHRVEKWFEIWDVLFPGVPRPESPWHEIPALLRPIPKDGEEYFAGLFLNILDHKIQQGDIPLPENNSLDLLRDRLKTVVQNTFRMYVNIRENFSSSTSSSSQGGPLHLGGVGSSTNRSNTISLPRTTTTAPTSIGTVPSNAVPNNPGPGAYTLASAYTPLATHPQQYIPAQFTTLPTEHDNHHTFYFGNHHHHPNMFAPQPQAGYWVPAPQPGPNVTHMAAFSNAHLPGQGGAGAEAWFNFGDAQTGFAGVGEYGHGGDEA